jgi:hypothetical protein
MSDSRVRTLLYVALALAAIQFLVVPAVQFRSELRDEVATLTKRLDRSEAVLKNKTQLQETSLRLQSSSAAVLQLIPRPADEDAFRLTTQQSISAMVGETGSTMSVFDWAFGGTVEGTDIRFVRSRMTITGEISSLAKLQALLDARVSNAVIRDWSLIAEREVGRGVPAKSSLNAVIDFHYRSAVPGAGS